MISALLKSSLQSHMKANIYKTFLKHNPNLGPKVDGYLKGGSRPADSLIGQNHYARGLVEVEDARRSLVTGPAISLPDFDVTVLVDEVETIPGGVRAENALIAY